MKRSGGSRGAAHGPLGSTAALALVLVAIAGHDARAASATFDRTAVRFFAPETGGSSKPRFVTERELAFEARLEALADQAAGSAAYDDRYVRAALDRHVAEEMLSALQIQSGLEPPDLPARADSERLGLVERLGGAAALASAMSVEGIDDSELGAILRRRARAAYYVDRALTPILHPSEEQLREVHRTSANPYKQLPFEQAKGPLERWFVEERLRVAETTFLQSARSRVRIVVVR